MILVLDLKHKDNFDVKVQDAEIGLITTQTKTTFLSKVEGTRNDRAICQTDWIKSWSEFSIYSALSGSLD